MGRVEGKVVFITGAARGQGRSHAVRLAAEGADIIGIDICGPVECVPYPEATNDDLAETRRLVERAGRTMVTASVDVRDFSALKHAVDEAVADLGRLDIVIANAGVTIPANALEMSEEIWSTVIDINLTGVWKTLKASVPHIIAGERGGSVVMTSSLAALQGHENIAHYSAAKAGLIGLMRPLAKELGRHSIRVNTVHPTMVGTPMVLNDYFYKLFSPDSEHPSRADFEVIAQTLNVLPVPMVDCGDVSNCILYLVSDEGRYVTGTTQMVDAGALLL